MLALPGADAIQPGAVQVSYGVGLDVERLDRVPRDPLALARRRLAASEVADLEGTELGRVGACETAAVLETCKEAFKALCGTRSLRAPLNSRPNTAASRRSAFGGGPRPALHVALDAQGGGPMPRGGGRKRLVREEG
jgi:hypothetical protein